MQWDGGSPHLTYIYHSGFAIETTRCLILIDYWEDTINNVQGWVHSKFLTSPKVRYILSSHAHHDHFNPQILRWKREHPDIQYIFSKDILNAGLVQADDAIFLQKGESFQDENILIQAFGSTDIGISFVLETEERKIFHAGDFNNWHWDEESTEEEIRLAETSFLRKLKILAKAYPTFDLVLFPVDPRLGRNYSKGASQFIDTIKTKTFIPMHFGKDYAAANVFKKEAEKRGCRFMEIRERGDSITF
ncbi:MAG: MBL fold metallo-hydrolase [Prevotellaceae bacterium]|nr:MBL fold metallo-hydrolase [Prevotellaceae bacterium]